MAVLALSSLLLAELEAPLRAAVLGVVALGGSIEWIRQGRRPKVHSLRILSAVEVELRQTDGKVSVATLGDAIAAPWGCVLRLRSDGRRFSLVVLPDALAAADFRFLVRRLRRLAPRRGQVSVPG